MTRTGRRLLSTCSVYTLRRIYESRQRCFDREIDAIRHNGGPATNSSLDFINGAQTAHVKIKESFQIQASPEDVWDFIVDPHKIGSTLPSLQSVEIVDEQHYKAVVKQKIGFVSATFEIHTEVLEQEQPRRLVLSNKGKTIFGAQGHLRSHDTITLTPLSENTTAVTLESDLKLGGQLAILGAKLIEAKSKEIFAEAASNLKEKLEAETQSDQ